MKSTIIYLTIISLVIAPSFCVSYDKFKEKKDDCMDKNNVTTLCQYEIFQNTGVLNIECSQDLYRSRICESTFDDCDKLKGSDEVFVF